MPYSSQICLFIQMGLFLCIIHPLNNIVKFTIIISQSSFRIFVFGMKPNNIAILLWLSDWNACINRTVRPFCQFWSRVINRLVVWICCQNLFQVFCPFSSLAHTLPSSTTLISFLFNPFLFFKIFTVFLLFNQFF